MKKHSSVAFLYIADIIILIGSFYLAALLKGVLTSFSYDQYKGQFFSFAAAFLIVSYLNRKYKLYLRKNLNSVIAKIILTNIYVLLVLITILYTFQYFFFSRTLIFGSLGIATVLELLVFPIMFFSYRFNVQNETFADTTLIKEYNENPLEVLEKTLKQKKSFINSFAADDEIKETELKPFLERILKTRNDDLLQFIEENVPMDGFSKGNSLILNSESQFNIEVYNKNELEFFLNLHRVNDIRRLNRYFFQVNEILKNGGVYCLAVETVSMRYDRILKTFGRFVGKFLYFFDFIFRRVFPKVPFFQGIYFGLTKGQNRALSFTETLGRLYFSGFEIINSKDINGTMYILVHKTGKPKEDTNPSYSPLIKMKRVGKNGKIIYVYKVRTMHPYSEYLHRFILDTFGYSKGGTGKPENDFRLTSWGKVLRKTWIDELPQLYNVLKGDLNLVGVRAVSQVRFEDIPKDLQELRIKFKPGCIPPSVVFKVIEQNQVDEAERKYLAEKQVRPYWTDFKYFWIAIYNILTGKIRSN